MFSSTDLQKRENFTGMIKKEIATYILSHWQRLLTLNVK